MRRYTAKRVRHSAREGELHAAMMVERRKQRVSESASQRAAIVVSHVPKAGPGAPGLYGCL